MPIAPSIGIKANLGTTWTEKIGDLIGEGPLVEEYFPSSYL